jgi:DNA-binding NarL/FixJ family response regulator
MTGRAMTGRAMTGRAVARRPLRIMVADDAALIRESLALLLQKEGFEVVAVVATADELLARLMRDPPDVAIVDIRMPPTFTTEGLVAAQRIRQQHPRVAVLLLSQYVDVAFAMQLLAGRPERIGYLLKDRVGDIPQLVEAIRRIAAGGSVVEPALVAELVSAPIRNDPLSALSPREREVLALLAEGRTDRGIAELIFVTPKTVEAHVRSIFAKLDLPSDAMANRRVHAVLLFLQARGHGRT